MVVNIDSTRFSIGRSSGSARSVRLMVQPELPERPNRCLTIGLVNNMAGAAFKATERQFVSLLHAASESIPIQVSFYTLPGVSRTESDRHHFSNHYASIEALLDTHLDGLIVTGREPTMPNLRDEPYWENFTQVLEWARQNTYSTVWSCLAAHAAVLHMDDIVRSKSDEKNFGVFECAQVSDHPLTQGLSPRRHVPHSRWNGVAQTDLTDHGYIVLSCMASDGVDTFIKQEESLFVFFQGHPEYETDTLMREYRRDVGRYLNGETNNYPLLPRGYFDRSTGRALAVLRDKAVSCRSSELLGSVAATLDRTQIENIWQNSAACIYRNWLQYIRARKAENIDERQVCSSMPISR
jgi:homoserine O-succinyltransferase/O-acetyltransferase